MSAKFSLIAIFLSVFSIALGMFFFRGQTSVRETMEKDPARLKSRVVLKDFVVRHFAEKAPLKFYKASLGLLTKDNLVDLFQVYAHESKEAANKTLSCKKVRVFFVDNSLSAILDNPQIQKASLSGNISLEQDSYILHTEKAFYNANLEMVYGNEPLEVKNKNHMMRGNKGFQLNLNSSEIRVFGKIEGIMTPYER